MIHQAKSMCVRGFVLAVTVFVFGFSSMGGVARAGCDDHVVLGGLAAKSEQAKSERAKNSHMPGKQKSCSGPQCSKQSPGLPAIPVDGPKWVVEKASLLVVRGEIQFSHSVSFPRPRSDAFFPPGHPGGIFDPPRS